MQNRFILFVEKRTLLAFTDSDEIYTINSQSLPDNDII